MSQMRIAIGISFSGPNFGKGLITIASIAKWATGSKHHVVLGVITPSRFPTSLTGLPNIETGTAFDAIRKVAAPMEVAFWDRNTTDRVGSAINIKHLRPFSLDFDYGETVNQILLMSFALKADLCLRADPGVCAPTVGFDH